MAAHPDEVTMPELIADERLLLAQIRHVGRALQDIEKLRIQHTLRRKSAERETGMPFGALLDTELRLEAIEHLAQLELTRLWRQHSLAGWQKQTIGIGEKQLARLIAEIGAPRVNKDTGEVHRAPLNSDTVSQLWAYCGFDPTRKPRKGMSQDEARGCGNPHAKSRAFLIAQKCVMLNGAPDKNGRARARSPYRDVYEARREATAGREWTDGHKHNDALRIVAKTILRDLWIASRHGVRDSHRPSAGGNS